jgi:hypothetical protein
LQIANLLLAFSAHMCTLLLNQAILVVTMANLANLLRLYSVLQRNRYTSQMDNMTTSDGRITISLKKMMMFADIVDDAELVGYDNLIRGPSAVEFQRFLSVTWDRDYNNCCRKFTFDLTASSDTITSTEASYNNHLTYHRSRKTKN